MMQYYHSNGWNSSLSTFFKSMIQVNTKQNSCSYDFCFIKFCHNVQIIDWSVSVDQYEVLKLLKREFHAKAHVNRIEGFVVRIEEYNRSKWEFFGYKHNALRYLQGCLRNGLEINVYIVYLFVCFKRLNSSTLVEL